MNKNILNKKFLISPFSIFDTIQKNWQDERKKWLHMGIKSEIGRDAECLPSGFDESKYGKKMSQGTSVFDPFLCEVLYTWFNIEGGTILDPFAGGSVRGIVAEKLGFKYTGIELRKEQVESNIEQAQTIGVNPKWIIGDSNKKLDEIWSQFDLSLTCPPYYDLEVYSDEEGDISNLQTYEEFLDFYGQIIKKTIDKTKDNRFIIYVVSNFRDKNGAMRDFVGDTIRLHTKHSGVVFYNDIILANAIGTLPVRVSSQFPKNRKVGKRHQNVLVFYKGDMGEIRDIYPKLNLESAKQGVL